MRVYQPTFFAVFSIFCTLICGSSTQSSSEQSKKQINRSNQYIVFFDTDHASPPEAKDVLESLGLHSDHANVTYVYDNVAFRGFSGSLQSHQVDRLEKMTGILFVKPAGSFSPAALPILDTPEYDRGEAPWGLQKISTIKPPTGDPLELAYDYYFVDPKLGQGADIYILDSGISELDRKTELGERVTFLWSFDDAETDPTGHGTAVAIVAAGNTLGVASAANLFSVKVTNDNDAYEEDLVAGMNAAVVSHHARQKSEHIFHGSVINLSFNGDNPEAEWIPLMTAVTKAGDAGIPVVIGAGNNGSDACTIAPQSLGGTGGNAIVVGAINFNGSKPSWSGHGECVDVYAPGDDIVIAGPATNVTGTKVQSGTSFSAPFVAGIIACGMASARTSLSETPLINSPSMIKKWLKTSAVFQNGTDGLLLAYNGYKTLFPVPEGPSGSDR